MIAQQFDLFGNTHGPQDLDLRDRVAYILEHHPECRDDDRLLTLWYWWEWNGLYNLLTQEQFESLLTWATQSADHPETIRRRRQEIQQLRTGTGSLQPSPTVAAARRELDSAGPPTRRGRR